MILLELTLENFHQYKGENIIEFAHQSGKNTTLIVGNNGAGKSNLFAALDWALYGPEQRGAGSNDGIVNKGVLQDAKKGDRVIAKVVVKFLHDEDKYVMTRELGALKQGKDLREVITDEQTSVTLFRISPRGDAEQVPNAEIRMNTILPRNAKQYFFFDGEQVLERFTKSGHEQEVYNAVREVLQYEVLERTAKHLDALAKMYQANLKGQAVGHERELREKEERLRDELDKKQAEIKTKQDERLKGKQLIEEIKQTLGSRKHAKGLIDERARLTAELQSLSERKDRLQDDIRSTAIQAFFPLSRQPSGKAHMLLEDKRMKGEIPAGIREQFLQDLLDRAKCICDRELHKGSSEEHAVRNLLNRQISGTLENALLSISSQLLVNIRESTHIQNALKSSMKDLVDCKKQMETLREQLEDIKSKLKKEDVEDISELEKKLEDHERRHEDLIVEIGSLRQRIEQIQKDIEAVRVELKEEEKRSKKAGLLSQKANMARDGADYAKKVLDTFADEMRSKIKDKSSDIFSQLIWKQAQFQNVTISESYELEVLDRWGQPARKELSAGERQFFSLAFILAMGAVTEAEAPFVIDTPLARIDDEPRRRLAEALPGLVPQLVLLMTNNEAAVEPYLKSHIGKKYKLDFRDGSTRIQEARI